MSSFLPEHESTQQYDTATQDQLPNLRSSAQRFAYYRAPEPEVHIDTSFARDGFPDFTQQSPMSEDTMSIELGRGAKGSTRDAPSKINDYEESSVNPILDLSMDSLYEASPAVSTRHRVASRKAIGLDRKNSLRKEASIRRAVSGPQPMDATMTSNFSNTPDTVPAKARSTSANQRRTLSDMHAKVNSESKSSFIGDDRPPATITNTKGSRFAKSRQVSAAEKAIPTRFTNTHGLLNTGDTPQPPISAVNLTFTGNQTQQSFMLPDLPDITELVSGLRKDGTSVFGRAAKGRSRFASGPNKKDNNTETLTYARLSSIEVPEDEKAIFASLQLLKDKVAHLEREKSEAIMRMKEYENEVISLKSQVQMEQKLRRPDSALGSDDEEGTTKEKWRIERSKLQFNIRVLSERLEKTERRVTVSDIGVKHMTQERDNLMTQLGVAYYNAEELKNENEQLSNDNAELQSEHDKMKDENLSFRNENEKLRAKLAQIKAQFQDETQHWNKRETELKKKIDRRDTSIKGLQDLTLTIPELQQRPKEQRSGRLEQDLCQDTKSNMISQIEAEIQKTRINASMKPSRADTTSRARSTSRSKSGSHQHATKSQRRVSSVKQPVENVESDASEAESTTNLDFTKPTRFGVEQTQQSAFEEGDTKDITYLSLIDPDEMANLRKKLEDERRAARQGRRTSAPASVPASAPVSAPLNGKRNDTQTKTGNLTRKSSLKDIMTAPLRFEDEDTGRFSVGSQQDESMMSVVKNVRIQSPNTSDAISYEDPKDCTDASMASIASRRRQRSKSVEEMTSAFILPDIIKHRENPTMTGRSASFENVITHDKANCTYCYSNHTEGKCPTIPMPVPVSKRDVDDTNATVRPSQPPAVALATVMKQLEDEVAHMKIELAKYERAYSAHNPALGRRQRKAVKDKMDTLMIEIERRSDQIYALYDVLEGQKQASAGAQNGAAVMNEDDVEETFQSLGIDADDLAERAAKKENNAKKTAPTTQRRTSNFSVSSGFLGESGDEMPWDYVSDEGDADSMDISLPKRGSISGGR